MNAEPEVKKIEQRVKEISSPLSELMESLDPTIKPNKRSAYSWGDDWDDDFGKWADETPPPWTGESRLI